MLVCYSRIVIKIGETGMDTQGQELFRAKDAATYLGVSVPRMYQLIEERSMGHRMLGVWVFTKQELDAFEAAPRDPRGRPRKTRGTRHTAPDSNNVGSN